ncbi:MAG: hypothetical protein QF654_10870 [Alphaproteobacteria bacterium]|nr:hypothetical protein [Alphaproteobacteria bacterium]
MARDQVTDRQNSGTLPDIAGRALLEDMQRRLQVAPDQGRQQNQFSGKNIESPGDRCHFFDRIAVSQERRLDLAETGHRIVRDPFERRGETLVGQIDLPLIEREIPRDAPDHGIVGVEHQGFLQERVRFARFPRDDAPSALEQQIFSSGHGTGRPLEN